MRKLQRMSSDELLFRSRAAVKRWYEEVCDHLGSDSQGGMEPVPEGQIVFTDPWIDPDDQRAIGTRLQAEYPEYVEKICRTADAICNRQFILLGVPVRYGSNISWHADPSLQKSVA